MAATKYTKSITTDFSGLTESEPCINTLIDAIRNSSITIALDYINESGDDVDIWFKDALSSGEQTTLTNLVAAHTGVVTKETVPSAEDGKHYVTPDLFPLGYFMVFAGIGDDITNGTKWGGDRFKIARSTSGTTDFEFQFIQHLLLAGGSVYRKNGEIDDYIDMLLYAPATVGTENTGAGAYDKYAIGGGINMFIPNADTEGDWDLNLSEKLNSNVDFTKCVPVPASGGNTGWFNYNKSTNVLTLNSDQKGAYNLFDSVINLNKHVNAAPLLGEGIGCSVVPAVKPALVLPHWKFKVSVAHGGDGNDLEVVWKLLIGVKSTT